MHDQMRKSKTIDLVVLENGNVSSALDRDAHVVTQTYRGPYRSHAPFRPNCALADVTVDATIVTCSTQNIYETRAKIARVTGLPVEKKTRIRYYEGSGTNGQSCYDAAARAAAVISQLAGKPVRVQFMRWDEIGWDNYGPAHLGEVRAAADAEGRIVAYEYQGWQHNWSVVETSAQLAGTAAAERDGSAAQQVSPLNLGSMYDVANV